MDDPQVLLEKYKELVPLILLGLAQVQQTREAAVEESSSVPPVPTAPPAPEPAPEPAPLPIPLETPPELPAVAAAPAPEPDVSTLVAALQQYMKTTAAPAITPAAVAPMVPKTIRDVDTLLKNNPLVLKLN